VAEEIAVQLHELGVEVEVVRPRDINDFFDRVIASRYDLVVAGWLADTLDPCDFLDAILASDRVPSYGNIAFSANHARLASAEVDQALHAYRSEPNPQRLAALVGAVSDQAAVVPILYGAAVTVSSYRVLNLQSSATEEIPFETLDLA
jgi:ABC-type oligopeptide transport system substrate-binding subunit